ncbi:MAG: hypothetical protein U1D30_19255 [Planctomycetota bacterium]
MKLLGNDHRKGPSDAGDPLLRESQARPGVNFLGVEWATKYAKEGAAKIAKRGIHNVRIVTADVKLPADFSLTGVLLSMSISASL